jgi:hypothetical protein
MVDPVRLVATELVACQSPSLPVDDRNRIVDWIIHDPYMREQIETHLEMVLMK